MFFSLTNTYESHFVHKDWVQTKRYCLRSIETFKVIADHGTGTAVEIDRVCGVSCSLSVRGCGGVSQYPPHDGIDGGDVDKDDAVEVCFVPELKRR